MLSGRSRFRLLRGRAERLARRKVVTPASATLHALRMDVLEGVATGVPLSEIADRLCRHVRRLAPDAICTILAVDADRRLRPLAAPHLAPAFSAAIDGVSIGPDMGTCGAAAHLNRPVLSLDIATDPAWAGFCRLPVEAGLVSCWSSPIRGRDGLASGTFAFYYRTRRGPDGWERRIVAACLTVCALAIEHEAVWSELFRTNGRFGVALTHMSQGLCFFDGEQRLIVANRRYAELYGLDPATIPPGTTLQQIVQLRIANGSGPRTTPEEYISWRDTLRVAPAASDTVVELMNGRTIAIHHQPMPDSGWVATHEDISERCRAEAQIAHMARHDALTGLPTRSLFQERAEQAMALCARGQSAALLCIDLDRFKEVNDTLGHPAGDLLLQQAATRLQACVREVDTVTRMGGDEFAILLVGLDRAESARDVGQRVVRMMAEPFDLDGHGVTVSASVGIALAPQDAATPPKLLRAADTALYRAKREGRGSFRFFEPGMDAKLQERLVLERDLRGAIENHELELAYQPIHDMASGRVCGFEALLRWRHKVHGVLMPADFIGLAEEAGLSVPIGTWVLRQACHDAAQWPPHIRVCINLSGGQFRDKTLSGAVAHALAECGLLPERLEIEITEALLLRQTTEVLAALHQLHALGVRVALDDFGSGYSSLRYLRTFPFDRVKIDQAALGELSGGSGSGDVLRAIVGLAHSFGMAAAAEGVETAEQLEQARGEGCGEVQGYLFGRPFTAADAQALVLEGKPADPAPRS